MNNKPTNVLKAMLLKTHHFRRQFIEHSPIACNKGKPLEIQLKE